MDERCEREVRGRCWKVERGVGRCGGAGWMRDAGWMLDGCWMDKLDGCG